MENLELKVVSNIDTSKVENSLIQEKILKTQQKYYNMDHLHKITYQNFQIQY